MADLELQHRVRIALSWRAEVQRLEAEARARFDAGELEAGRYRHLQQKLTAEQSAAQRALENIRAREGHMAARLGAHLRDCLGRKTAMGQQVKDGSIAHDIATAELGRLEEEIKALREAVTEFNRVLSAEDPAAIGGKLEMRLEEYATRLAGAEAMLGETQQPTGGFARFRLNRRQARIALVCSTFVVLGMLAIWFMARQNRNIEMVAEWSSATPSEISVACANHGAQDFVLYVPAPENGTPMQEGAFSFRVEHSGPAGNSGYLPTWGAWTADGSATQYTNPQRLLAGKHQVFVLHVDRTAATKPGLHRFDIQCVNSAGHVVNHQSVDATIGTGPT